MNMYPLKPVVCNDATLAQAYDQHERSLFHTSNSLSVEEIIEAVNQGVQFDSLILVNGQGEELVYHIGERFAWNQEKLPKIIRVNVPEHTDKAVDEIHCAIHHSSVLNVWAG